MIQSAKLKAFVFGMVTATSVVTNAHTDQQSLADQGRFSVKRLTFSPKRLKDRIYLQGLMAKQAQLVVIRSFDANRQTRLRKLEVNAHSGVYSLLNSYYFRRMQYPEYKQVNVPFFFKLIKDEYVRVSWNLLSGFNYKSGIAQVMTGPGADAYPVLKTVIKLIQDTGVLEVRNLRTKRYGHISGTLFVKGYSQDYKVLKYSLFRGAVTEDATPELLEIDGKDIYQYLPKRFQAFLKYKNRRYYQ